MMMLWLYLGTILSNHLIGQVIEKWKLRSKKWKFIRVSFHHRYPMLIDPKNIRKKKIITLNSSYFRITRMKTPIIVVWGLQQPPLNMMVLTMEIIQEWELSMITSWTLQEWESHSTSMMINQSIIEIIQRITVVKGPYCMGLLPLMSQITIKIRMKLWIELTWSSRNRMDRYWMWHTSGRLTQMASLL